jgi:hypothetical protein
MVRASISALRLFQLARRRSTEPRSFGLPGDLHSSVIEYVAVWENAAMGAIHQGHYAGWTFTPESYDDWQRSPAFQFLSVALCDPDRDEGTSRAVAGMLLLDRAAVEYRSDLKMIGFSSALEAWLLRRVSGSQTMRLARHTAWFGCGAHNGDLCGRARPICPYLHLSPASKIDRVRITTLRELGNTHTAWRCSEWHRVMDWYEARSNAVHGDLTAVDKKHADEAEYWISHYLAEPILLWLRDNPADPITALEQLLDSNVDPSNWHQMISALDAKPPPGIPPAP